jgi:hypothetical protein
MELARRRPMSRILRHSVAASIGAVAISVVACSSVDLGRQSGSNAGQGPLGTLVNEGQGAVGSVAMHLDIGPNTTLTSIHWSIGNGTNAYAGTASIGDAQSVEFVAGGILAGSGYTVTITATDSQGDPCAGTSSPFAVNPGAVTQIVLAVTCTAPPDGSTTADVTTGSVEIDASVTQANTAVTCPGIRSFSISPAEINPSQTAALSLQTVGPTPLVTWSVTPAGGGTFGDVNAANTTFACSPGPLQVTVTATVALPDSGACNGQPFTSTSALVNCEPQCTSASSCPSSTTACKLPLCTGNVCGFTNAAEGTSCTDSGGTICNGLGSCIPFTFEVARIGSGTGAISANATAVFLEQRRVSDGSLVATLPLPTSANPDAGVAQPFSTTGTSITEGDLSRSVDGRYLSIAGYAAVPGTATPTSSTTLNRVIARIDAAGNVDTSTVLAFTVGTDVLFGGGNPRGTSSIDGSSFWVGGTGVTSGTTNTGGIWFVPFGTSASAITMANQVNAGPTRSVKIFGGQLYGDGDTTQTPEVFAAGTGLPQTGPQPATELPGLPAVASAGLWSFVLLDLNPAVPGVDTLYLASSTVLALSGDAGTFPMGILKFTFNGTTWSFANAFGPASGARGLAGLANPATNAVTLITSTVETGSTTNHVEVFVDNGTTVTAGPTVQSTTNTLYRGVALTPHP